MYTTQLRKNSQKVIPCPFRSPVVLILMYASEWSQLTLLSGKLS